MLPYRLSLNEIHELKHILNYVISEELYFSTIVLLREGGYINYIMKNPEEMMLNFFIPIKKNSKQFCTFYLNLKKKRVFRNLRSIDSISGPYIYMYQDEYMIHQHVVDLNTVDHLYIQDVIHKILSNNFAIVNSGWKDDDKQMKECKLFRNMMKSFESCFHNDIILAIRNGLRCYQMKKISRHITTKYHWKKWIEHWMDPDNEEGFIKRLKDRPLA